MHVIPGPYSWCGAGLGVLDKLCVGGVSLEEEVNSKGLWNIFWCLAFSCLFFNGLRGEARNPETSDEPGTKQQPETTAPSVCIQAMCCAFALQSCQTSLHLGEDAFLLTSQVARSLPLVGGFPPPLEGREGSACKQRLGMLPPVT